MKAKIQEFEKAAIEAVSALRNELGAERVSIEILVDNYGSGCKTDVKFFKSIPANPGCGPACKAD